MQSNLPLILFTYLSLTEANSWFIDNSVGVITGIYGSSIQLEWTLKKTKHKVSFFKDEIKLDEKKYIIKKRSDERYTTITLTLKNVQQEDSGIYRCKLVFWDTYKDINLTIIKDLKMQYDIKPLNGRLGNDVTVTWTYKHVINKKIVSIYRKKDNINEKILSIFPDGSEAIKRGLSDVNVTVSRDDITETVAFTLFNTTADVFNYSYSLNLEFSKTIYKQSQYIKVNDGIENKEKPDIKMDIGISLVSIIPLCVIVILLMLIVIGMYVTCHKTKHREMNNEAPTMTQSTMVVRSPYETVVVADETNSRHSTASVSSSSLSDANPYLNPYDSVNRDEISTIPNSYIPLLIQTSIPCENDARGNNVQDTDVDSNLTPRSDRGSAKLIGDQLMPLNINNIIEHHSHDSSDHDYTPNACDSRTQDVADSTYLTPVFERY